MEWDAARRRAAELDETVRCEEKLPWRSCGRSGRQQEVERARNEADREHLRRCAWPN